MAQWEHKAVYLKIRPEPRKEAPKEGMVTVATPAVVDPVAGDQEVKRLAEYLDQQASKGWDLFSVTSDGAPDRGPCFIFRRVTMRGAEEQPIEPAADEPVRDEAWGEPEAAFPPPVPGPGPGQQEAAAVAAPPARAAGTRSVPPPPPGASPSPSVPPRAEEETNIVYAAIDAASRGNPQGWAEMSFIARTCSQSGLSTDRMYEIFEVLEARRAVEWSPSSQTPRRGGWVRRIR
jgi:hypothetical protein